MVNSNVHEERICPECKMSVKAEARRCGNCGITLSRLKRLIIQFSTIVSAILLIVPVWQLAINTTDLFKRTVSFDLRSAGCTNKTFSVSIANLESDRLLKWTKPILVSINNREINTNMHFSPGEAQHLPPLTERKLELFLLNDSIKIPKEGTKQEFRVVVAVTTTEIDGSRPTSKTATCIVAFQ